MQRRKAFSALGLFIAAMLCFVLVIEVMKEHKREKISCVVKYLKDEKTCEDESFNAVGHFTGDYQQCLEARILEWDEFLNATRLRLENITGKSDCVVERLRTHEIYEEKVLLAEVLDYAKITLLFWKYFERKSNADRLNEEVKIIEDIEVNYCAASSRVDDWHSEKQMSLVEENRTPSFSEEYYEDSEDDETSN